MNASLVLKFPVQTKKVHIRYGISFIDEAQAKKNFSREIEGKDVLTIQNKARQIWNDALNKIEVEGGSSKDKTVFYTSLYRTYERPVCLSEDGRYYSAFDNKIHKD
jgi:putative alpha-1,2-mannosidase